ncbi:MAG: pectinesterase family protein [Ignavibacteria bacterium]
MPAVFAFLIFIAVSKISFPLSAHQIVVAKDGSGDFISITHALQSLPMFNYQRIEIFIKNGIYVEKLRIDQDYITLRGESREKTVIQYYQPRENWMRKKDSIGPAVVNIFADDIILADLTIENIQPDINTHAFAVYGTGTRVIIAGCNILSRGGDTVALWSYKSGMYYHSDCYFKGAVDFICPRGWCYIKNSNFYEVKKSASIWHAGGFDMHQKLVIENSSFDGVENFQLGRHHYEAQFFLISCKFTNNMADHPIYRVTYSDTSLNRPFNWGERYYFYNCSREGENFSWFKNNLSEAEAAEISALWTFDGKWDPESGKGPELFNYKIENNDLILFFREIITVMDNPVIKSASGKTFFYHSGGGSNTIRFVCESPFAKNDIAGLKIINFGKLIGTIASVDEREAVLNFIQ